MEEIVNEDNLKIPSELESSKDNTTMTRSMNMSLTPSSIVHKKKANLYKKDKEVQGSRIHSFNIYAQNLKKLKNGGNLQFREF